MKPASIATSALYLSADILGEGVMAFVAVDIALVRVTQNSGTVTLPTRYLAIAIACVARLSGHLTDP